MNKIYKTASFAKFEMNVTNINRNFRIKVYGMVNGVKVNKLVAAGYSLGMVAKCLSVDKF